MYAHRVALAVPDFGGSFEKESRSLSGSKNNIDVAGLCCGVCGGFQPCVDGLEDVRLDKVMGYVTGGTKNGFKGGVGVVREMRVYEGRKKRPASVLCAFYADGVDASVLVEVEERVHVVPGKEMEQSGVGDSDGPDLRLSNKTFDLNGRQKTDGSLQTVSPLRSLQRPPSCTTELPLHCLQIMLSFHATLTLEELQTLMTPSTTCMTRANHQTPSTI